MSLDGLPEVPWSHMRGHRVWPHVVRPLPPHPPPPGTARSSGGGSGSSLQLGAAAVVDARRGTHRSTIVAAVAAATAVTVPRDRGPVVSPVRPRAGAQRLHTRRAAPRPQRTLVTGVGAGWRDGVRQRRRRRGSASLTPVPLRRGRPRRELSDSVRVCSQRCASACSRCSIKRIFRKMMPQ